MLIILIYTQRIIFSLVISLFTSFFPFAESAAIIKPKRRKYLTINQDHYLTSSV